MAGENARYIESGGTDNTGANLSTRIDTGSGSSVVIGDPNANQTISDLAQTIAASSQGGGGGGGTSPTPVLLQQAAAIPWTMIGIIAGAVILLALLFKRP